jgi:methylated-DNA-protein-cysteine methyltransferase-like protein
LECLLTRGTSDRVTHVSSINASEPNSDTSCNVTALKYLSPAADPPVPWQRVISSAGNISPRGPGTDGAQRQREALEAEDVEVRVGRANELLVDLAEYGWFPAPGTIRIDAA